MSYPKAFPHILISLFLFSLYLPPLLLAELSVSSMSVSTHCFTSPCHDRTRFFSGDDGNKLLRKRIKGTFLVKILPSSQNAYLRITAKSSRPLSGFRSGISKVKQKIQFFQCVFFQLMISSFLMLIMSGSI